MLLAYLRAPPALPPAVPLVDVDTANETVDQFVLTAREILHTDSKHRENETLRELLVNMTHLEIEEGEAYK